MLDSIVRLLRITLRAPNLGVFGFAVDSASAGVLGIAALALFCASPNSRSHSRPAVGAKPQAITFSVTLVIGVVVMGLTKSHVRHFDGNQYFRSDLHHCQGDVPELLSSVT